MILYPAMDLMNGWVVRLKQGRFDDSTEYATEPAEALAQFAEAGASWAHVVDLDGAKAGAPAQHDLIGRLARQTPIKLQVGGGIRSEEQVDRLLASGVSRVIVGSLAVIQPDRVRGFFELFGPEAIGLALDVRIIAGEPILVTSGWTETSNLSLWDAAASFPEASHILLTDVGQDGMLSGPNFSLLEQAVERLPNARIQASGGVGTIEDLRRLTTAGAIVGKALWEGRFTLREALDAVA